MLGLPLANSGPGSLGLDISTGLDGLGLLDDGEAMTGDDGGWRERDECGAIVLRRFSSVTAAPGAPPREARTLIAGGAGGAPVSPFQSLDLNFDATLDSEFVTTEE